jgi:hypothetical protein
VYNDEDIVVSTMDILTLAQEAKLTSRALDVPVGTTLDGSELFDGIACLDTATARE